MALRAVVAVAFGALAIAPGCASKFDGPYPCVTGFASCASANGCETNLTSDATSCGACGAACPLGGVCVASACVPGASVLAAGTTATKPTNLAANASGVYWTTNGQMNGELLTVPASGGAPEAVLAASSLVYAFAFDATNLYFAGQLEQPTGMGTTPVSAIWQRPLAGGTPTELAPLPQASESAAALVVAGGSVVWLDQSSGSQSEPLDRVATTGGTVTTVGTLADVGEQSLVADAHELYVATGDACAIEAIPLSGGAPAMLASTSDDGCPQLLATDGVRVYWVATTETQLDDEQDGDGLQPTRCVLAVRSVPVGGGSVSTLASFPTYELPTSIATDGVSVYFSTFQNLRKVPVLGGDPVAVAGSFGAPPVTTTPSSSANGVQCGSPANGNNPSASTVTIAVGPSAVYIADGFNGDILQAPK